MRMVSRRQSVAAIGMAVVLSGFAQPAALAQDVLGETGVKGAGSTFVYPILSKWSREYRQFLARGGDYPVVDGGLDDPPASSALEYEPVGSLAGALRVKDRAVDFGATDMPLESGELAALGLGQFPLVIGGVVVALNVDGVASGRLRLTGPVLADIYLGKITRWSDPAIAAINPELRLPAENIAVIHRSDGSGTTFNFTAYLAKVSPEWKLKASSGLLVQWPTGTGAKGNEGVAQAVRATRNAIGYVEYAHASHLNLALASLQNRAGRFVRPGPAGFHAAAAAARWSATDDFRALLIDLDGEQAYPITATVFVLMNRKAPRARLRPALDFFRWSLTRGGSTADQLGYVPLPAALVVQVQRYWADAFGVGS
jgi:phosphate transport system substrate-binding protein